MTIIFSIAGYPESVSGAPGETKSFQVTVSNDGDENGDVILRIKDHNGNIVFSEQQTIYVGTCYIFNVSITLPSQAGTYTWTIEAYNVSTSNVDDTKTFTVEVTEEEAAPEIDWTQIFIQMLILMFIILLASLLVSVLA